MGSSNSRFQNIKDLLKKLSMSFHYKESGPEKQEPGEEKLRSTVLLIDSDGLSDYTSYLACGLAKYRNIILYGFSKESYIATGAIKEKRIKFYYIKEKLPKGTSLLQLIGRPFFMYFILFKALTKTQYEIVHVQGHLPTFFLFIPILKLKRKRIFWTIHDLALMPSYRGVKGLLEVSYIRIVSQPWLLSKYSNIIVVHSIFLKKRLVLKRIKENNIHVIRHFDYRYLLDSSYTDCLNESQSNRSSGNSTGNGYILCFGRITPYKGIDVLVKALKKVTQQTNNRRCDVLLSGKGETSYFDSLLTREDYEYIHIYNKYITKAEIPDIFKNSLFVVLPYTQAFKYSVSGIIPLAYTFSKPVIVSDVGSLTEYVDHDKTGYIFKSGNSTDLADYIIKLVENNDKCTEMGKSGYQKMLREMSLENCSKTLNNLYETVAM